MKKSLLILLVAMVFNTAHAACPSDDEDFCSTYESAMQGEAWAQYNLGLMYANGEGVITDYREASIWWSIAKANGSELAANSLRENKWNNYLTSTEIKSAKREAARRLEAMRQRD